MEIGKVSGFMDRLDEINRKGGRATPEDRNLYDRIRTASVLDRVDMDVLALLPNDATQWEPYQGVVDATIGATGELSILVGGYDADGDYCTASNVCYPAGRWFKYSTKLVQIPNPYYVDPDQPDPSDLPPSGF